jgi:hypothetical protein
MTGTMPRLALACCVAALAACAPTGPSAREIEASVANQDEVVVRSAEGPWSGVAAGNSLQVEFSLSQAPGGQVQGAGFVRAPGAAPVPMTVTGTYARPNLTLTFSGLVFEGREVVGSFGGTYTSAAGVSSVLRLAADGYERAFPLLLHEGPPAAPSLGGRLTDAVAGVPVSGATVSVAGRTVQSSPTGHYGFDPNLTAGRFPVTVTHPLYLDAARDVEIGPYAIADFRLQPK